jgi:CheY-like chemotaxis protein
VQASALRVLMVDESSLDAKMNLRALEGKGFQITRDLISSPNQLISCLRENRYDVVLSDYFLRGWTGLDVLRLLREQCPATPLLIVAERMHDDLTLECLKQGAADCINKGELDRLPDAVSNAVQHARTSGISSTMELSLAMAHPRD